MAITMRAGFEWWAVITVCNLIKNTSILPPNPKYVMMIMKKVKNLAMIKPRERVWALGKELRLKLLVSQSCVCDNDHNGDGGA